jgi:hypothetical protein
MSILRSPVFACAALLALAALSAPAAAQSGDNSLKTCGDLWRTARAAGAVEPGLTWTQFLARCRATLDGGTPPAAAPTPQTGPRERAPASGEAPQRRPRAERHSAPAVPRAAEPVFPAGVPSKFASEKPARARQKACSEQFKANKATGCNAGLRWFEKGGGYWSACNKRLKEISA